MIHAENGDMIQWLTSTFMSVLSRSKFNINLDKLESKGMVGMFYPELVIYQIPLTASSPVLPRLIPSALGRSGSHQSSYCPRSLDPEPNSIRACWIRSQFPAAMKLSIWVLILIAWRGQCA